MSPQQRQQAIDILAQGMAAQAPDEDPQVIQAAAEALIDAADQIRLGGDGGSGDSISSQLDG
jgi:hypothetical protein